MKKTKLVRIIDRHIEAMLEELKANGIKTAGIAGGIMLVAKTIKVKGSICHTFVLADSNFTLRDGAPMTIEGLVTDIANSLQHAHGPSTPTSATKH